MKNKRIKNTNLKSEAGNASVLILSIILSLLIGIGIGFGIKYLIDMNKDTSKDEKTSVVESNKDDDKDNEDNKKEEEDDDDKQTSSNSNKNTTSENKTSSSSNNSGKIINVGSYKLNFPSKYTFNKEVTQNGVKLYLFKKGNDEVIEISTLGISLNAIIAEKNEVKGGLEESANQTVSSGIEGKYKNIRYIYYLGTNQQAKIMHAYVECDGNEVFYIVIIKVGSTPSVSELNEIIADVVVNRQKNQSSNISINENTETNIENMKFIDSTELKKLLENN